jgi:hypothetical protein
MLIGAVAAASFLFVVAAGLAAGFVRGQAEERSRYLLSFDRAEQAFYAARRHCETSLGEEGTLPYCRAWRPMAGDRPCGSAASQHTGILSSPADD